MPHLRLRIAFHQQLLCLVAVFHVASATVLPTGLETRLTQAALKVIRTHSSPTYAYANPVPVLSTEDLMYSNYNSKNSIGDREELQVTKLALSTLKTDLYGSARWTHLHHNHSDYLMATTRNNVHLWSLDGGNVELKTTEALFRYSFGGDELIDATAFTRSERNQQTMYLVFVVRTGMTAKLMAYEVDITGQVMLFALPLAEVPIKVRWLESQQQGALVLLYPSAYNEISLSDFRQGKTVLSHIIHIRVPMAVDLETAVIGGYGYITVCNATTVAVYRSDELANSFRLFDIIHGSELTDIALFRVGFETLLAVAGQQKQFVYVWRGGGFFLRQVFVVRNCYQWYPVAFSSCRDDVLMAMATTDKSYPLRLFAWSAQLRRFTEIERRVVPLGGFLVYKDSMASYSVKDNAWIVFTDGANGASKIVVISTKVALLPNPVEERGSQTVLRMKAAKDYLDKQQALMSKASQTLGNAISAKKPVNFLQMKHMVKKLLVNGPIAAGISEIPQGLVMEGSPVSLTELQSRMPQLRRALGDVGFKVRRLTAALRDAVYKNESATIPALKIVKGALLTPQLRAKETSVDTLRGVATSDLLRDIYWFDKPVTIAGRVLILKPSKVKGVLRAPLINGVDITKAVTVDGHHTLTGRTIFTKPLNIMKDSILEGSLNNMKLSTFATLSGNHYISAPKQFALVTVQAELSVLRLDGVDITSTVLNTLNSVDSQAVTGALTFAGNVQSRDIFSNTVNGLHVPDLATRFVRLDRPAAICGFKTFTTLTHVASVITIGGKLNALQVPYDLLLRDAEQVVKGRKRFTRVVSGVTTVDGRVNGLKLPNDVYRVTDNEAINVPLAFHNGIIAARDIHVTGTTDSVDISDYARYLLSQPNKTVKGDVVFRGKLFVHNSMTLGGRLNQLLVDELYKDAIFPGGNKVLAITGRKTFSRGIDVEHMTVKGGINGYSLLEDFVATEDHQDIEGHKLLTGPVTFENALDSTNGIVDGVDVYKTLSERITLGSEQNITAEPVFVDTVTVDHLYNLGHIQGLSVPSDFVLKSVPQKVYGTKHFSRGLKGNLVDVRVEATVNGPVGGVDIANVFKKRVTLGGHQVIAAQIMIQNSTVPSFNARLLNNQPAAEFLNNVMSKSQPQSITAPKTFEGVLQALAPVTSVTGVNGVHLSEVNNNAVRLNELSVVTQGMSFKDTFTVYGKVNVRGHLDGRDLQAFEADTVSKDGWLTIRGNSVFYKGFNVRGDIAADSVNDIMLGYDLLLKTADQTVKGRYAFAKSLKVLGDLPHTGHVNNIDLSVLDLLIMKADRENVLKTSLDFSQMVHVATDMHVDGLVNGHKLTSVKEGAMCNAGRDKIIGPKVFRGPIDVLGTLDVQFFNNRSLPHILDDLVYLDGYYTTAPKAFHIVHTEGIIKARSVVFDGLVNGVSVKEKLASAVPLTGNCVVTGKKHFKHPFVVNKDMSVLGSVNGVMIPKDIVQLCHTKACPMQHLTRPTFESLQVPGHLPVSNGVNGQNLPLALRNTFRTHGNQTVAGTKHLQNAVFNRNVLAQRVNGKIFRRDVIPLRTPQMLRSALLPSDVVTTNVAVKGLINDYKIQDVAKDAVYLNKPQTIRGPVVLNQVVVHADINLHGLVDGIALPQINKGLAVLDHSISQIGNAMSQKLNAHEEIISQTNCFLKNSYSTVDHFVAYQFLDVEATTVDAATGVGSLRLIDAHTGTPESRVYHFSWGKDKLWHFNSEASTDEGERVYLRLEGKLLWLDVPLPDSDKKRGILTDGTAVLHNFGDVISMSALQRDHRTGIAASLTRSGVCDFFKFTLRTEPVLIGTLNPGPEAKAVKLATLKGSVYALISLHDPQACLVETTRSKIYIWETADRWTLVQQLYGGSVISTFVKNEMLYALFSDVDVNSHCNIPSTIKVYRTCESSGSPFELFQVMPVISVSKIEILKYGNQHDVYMVAANRTSAQVYLFGGESGFRILSTIPSEGLTDVKPIVLQDELYLITAQGYNQRKTIIYKAVTKGPKEAFQLS
ncbi:uncharacterized protein LOC135401280 [Ornithodoros turicata]|uniref:uncharacterized protein LOC135401280 n=1 Tax=Ornithodoros turicata TaxID=34597 RepID=UPI003138BBF5